MGWAVGRNGGGLLPGTRFSVLPDKRACPEARCVVQPICMVLGSQLWNGMLLRVSGMRPRFRPCCHDLATWAPIPVTLHAGSIRRHKERQRKLSGSAVSYHHRQFLCRDSWVKRMTQGTIMTELMTAAKGFTSLADLKHVIDKVKHAKVVMLGEASHGTHEFYEWRRLISQELIANHGFSFIGVEGDWPPTQRINHFIGSGTGLDPHPEAKPGESARDVLGSFKRWPTWMWANTEVEQLVGWMREWNNTKGKRRVGFHGLDVYSLFESIEETVRELEKVDPAMARKARIRYQCFDPYLQDEKDYVRSLMYHPKGCREAVLKTLGDLLQKRLDNNDQPGTRSALWDATQNARIVKNAETYYRAMVEADDRSWNVRDQHMMETLDVLLNHYGPESKGIVWAHNTHIGDYRATSMKDQDMVNIGGLAREKYEADQVALVGFATYEGTVIASHIWGGEVQVLPVPPGRIGSWDSALHSVAQKIDADNLALVFTEEQKKGSFGDAVKGQRAIGVVYNPAFERWGNYVPTSLARRYDAVLFLDKTQALEPLGVESDKNELPEAYPFGV